MRRFKLLYYKTATLLVCLRALKRGYKLYPVACNKNQKAWALSAESALKLPWGASLYELLPADLKSAYEKYRKGYCAAFYSR